MSEETEMTPITPVDGMVPPKVAPFGAAPQEESVPAAAPAEAPAAEAPAASGPKTIKLRPVIRKPVIGIFLSEGCSTGLSGDFRNKEIVF